MGPPAAADLVTDRHIPVLTFNLRTTSAGFPFPATPTLLLRDFDRQTSSLHPRPANGISKAFVAVHGLDMRPWDAPMPLSVFYAT